MKNPLKPRKSPTQARAQETVDAILKSTAHILVEGQDHEITTNGIAKKAGVSIGSLYQYFPRKESILAALTEKYLDKRLNLIEAKLSDLGGLPIDAAIDQLIDTLIELKVKNLKLERALLSHFSRSGDPEVIRRLDERVIRVLNRVLATRQSELRHFDEDWTGFVLLQAVRGVLFATLTHRPQKIHDPGLREEMRRLVRGFLRA